MRTSSYTQPLCTKLTGVVGIEMVLGRFEPVESLLIGFIVSMCGPAVLAAGAGSLFCFCHIYPFVSLSARHDCNIDDWAVKPPIKQTKLS